MYVQNRNKHTDPWLTRHWGKPQGRKLLSEDSAVCYRPDTDTRGGCGSRLKPQRPRLLGAGPRAKWRLFWGSQAQVEQLIRNSGLYTMGSRATWFSPSEWIWHFFPKLLEKFLEKKDFYR